MSSINLQTPIVYPSVVFFSIRIVTILATENLVLEEPVKIRHQTQYFKIMRQTSFCYHASDEQYNSSYDSISYLHIQYKNLQLTDPGLTTGPDGPPRLRP